MRKMDDVKKTSDEKRVLYAILVIVVVTLIYWYVDACLSTGR